MAEVFAGTVQELRTSIPSDTACCGSFLLDSQVAFRYSSSLIKSSSYHLSPHLAHPPITIPVLKIIGGLLIALGLFFVCRLKVCPR